MPAAADRPTHVLTDTRGALIAVDLHSRHALDPGLVGDGACRLATAAQLGLPVADGVVVTMAGVAHDAPLIALRHAWLRTRGQVHITLSDQGAGSGISANPSECDASTWSGLLDGLYALLAYDRAENPSRAGRPWAIVILAVPEGGTPVLVRTGPRKRVKVLGSPDGWGLTRSSRNRLASLARRVMAALGRPVSIEAVEHDDGNWHIVDIRYRESWDSITGC